METSEDRKVRTVRVRKIVSADPRVNQSESRRTKKIKIARRVSIDPLIQGPIPGSLEEDFLLEAQGDPKSFLKVTFPEAQEVPDFGPRYYQEGRLVPYSVVGSADLFEKLHSAEVKTGVVEEKGQQEQGTGSGGSRRTILMSLRKVNKSPSETPEQRFQLKQTRIEEGKRRDAQEESSRVHNLPPGLRLLEDRQRKCLKEFEHAQRDWNQLAASLSNRTGKSKDALVQNQLQEYREKLEALDSLDRGVPVEEKAGSNGWYMSLRAGGNELRGTCLPVGNMFSGIYAQVRDRTKTAEALIRRPLPIPATSLPVFSPIPEEDSSERPIRTSVSTRKTFRDSPYFQRRIKEEAKKQPDLIQGNKPVALCVQGVAKFQAELRALHAFGLEAFKPELLKAGETGVEVIAEQYDVKFKY